ncbi:hypothetical protein GN956_G17578 [Arapaima gigas]
MSRPRSRSPLHPYRSSGSNRSPGCFNDRRYGTNQPLDSMNVDLQRDCGKKSRTMYREDEWHWEERLRRGLLEERRTDVWRRAHFPNLTQTQRCSPPVGLDDRQGRYDSELDYGERRRLSPRRWPHSPGTSSGGGRRTEDHNDFQRYPGERGVPQERLGVHHDSRLSRRTSQPGWDRSSHGKGMKEQEWISDRNARDYNQKEGSFVRPGWRKRCAEDAGFLNSRHSSEWLAQRGPGGCTKSSPIIVEHDHGISDRGQFKEDAHVRQDYGYHHSRDQWHLREGRPKGDHRKGFELIQEDPRDRPSQARRKSPANIRRSPVHETGISAYAKRSPIQESRSSGRKSPSPNRTRRQEVAKTLEFLTNLALDANGDIDLRHIESNLSMKNVSPARNPATVGVKQDCRLEKMPQRVGQGAPRAAANRSQTQETLTIKIDMGHSAGQHSVSLPSDRQLSVDLISVGRQRLDFLPMLEQSGAHGESAVHSGTFAQEIITLVHQVKEHYFKETTLTLNERFSAVQSDLVNEETEKEKKVGPTCSPRINRRIDMSLSELRAYRDTGYKQKHKRRLAVDPSDLRHDLERRRQERLEEVKVTIPGVAFQQCPPLPGSLQNEMDLCSQAVEHISGPARSGKSSSAGRWGKRRANRMRPGVTRLGFSVQKKSNRLQNPMGPSWHQNCSNTNGADW